MQRDAHQTISWCVANRAAVFSFRVMVRRYDITMGVQKRRRRSTVPRTHTLSLSLLRSVITMV
jgi:hypothetical protein